jgi:hypothetical protein
MTDWRDSKIQKLCVAHIEKHSMDSLAWKHTLLGRCHEGCTALGPNELAVVSVYFSADSWSVLTTQRVFGNYFGRSVNVPTLEIANSHFGDFKGLSNKHIEVLTLLTSSGEEMQLEYETGKASMAPIYYFRFWDRKVPILEKLVG